MCGRYQEAQGSLAPGCRAPNCIHHGLGAAHTNPVRLRDSGVEEAAHRRSGRQIQARGVDSDPNSAP